MYCLGTMNKCSSLETRKESNQMKIRKIIKIDAENDKERDRK